MPVLRRTPCALDMVCAVLVPAGKIAMGKLAQALVHGARLLQVDGSFDDCLTLAQPSEDYPVALVNSVSPARIEGQKTASFEIVDQLGKRRTSTACRSATPEHHRLLDGIPGVLGQTPDVGIPGSRCRPDRAARPCATPRRSLPPSGSGTRLGRRRPRRLNDSGGLIDMVTDRQILIAYKVACVGEGVFVVASAGWRAVGAPRRR